MEYKEILEILKNSDYKEVVKALMLLENSSLTDENLEELYNNFMNDDNITGLLNDSIGI